MIRRPPRSTRMTHSFPTRRSSDLVGFVADVGYALDPLVLHRLGDLLDKARFAHLIGDFGKDDRPALAPVFLHHRLGAHDDGAAPGVIGLTRPRLAPAHRSEEHTSELQSLMRISYAVFCLKTKSSTP